VIDAQQRHVESDADDVCGLEPLQIRAPDVVGHHCESFEPPVAPRNRLEQTLVVAFTVAGVRTHEHRVLHPVRVEHPYELGRGAYFLAGRQVIRVRGIGKPRRIEDMVVTVDLRFVVDGQLGSPSLR
jgi:hypothetical protein